MHIPSGFSRRCGPTGRRMAATPWRCRKPSGRAAQEVLHRHSASGTSTSRFDFHFAFTVCIWNALTPSRGVLWVRFLDETFEILG